MNIVKFFAEIDKALPNGHFSPVIDGQIHAYDARHKMDVPDKDQPDCYIGFISWREGTFYVRGDYSYAENILALLRRIKTETIPTKKEEEK